MRTIIRTFIIIVLGCILFSSSCRDKYPGEPLAIGNNTDDRIYHWFAYWKNFPNWTLYHYPDTILPNKRPADIFSIAPHNKIGGGESDPNWGKIFSELPVGKFSVYFFMKNPKTQEEWDSIRVNNAYYRKDVTYQELVDNHYVIYFP